MKHHKTDVITVITSTPTLMHGNAWTGQDVTGWLASEKLRGWRLLWTGKEYVLRGGGVLDVPAAWLDGMPPTPLDGELYAGPHQHEGRVSSAVASGSWDKLTFHPFDIPIEGTTTEAAQTTISNTTFPAHVRPVAFARVESTNAALAMRDAVVRAGGEGIMLRRPGTGYQPFRNSDLLKLKP